MPLRPPRIPKARFYLQSKGDREKFILMRYNYRSPDDPETVIMMAYGLGEKIPTAHWDHDRQRAKNVNNRQYRDLNKRLDRWAEIAEQVFIDFGYGDLTKEQFRLELDYRSGAKKRPEDKPAPTLISFMEEYIERQKSRAGAKRGTWKKFPTVLNHLKAFAEDHDLPTLAFDDINWRFRYEFVEWLYLPPRNHSINNASKVMEVIKQTMREAQKLGLHNNLTYTEKGFGVKRVRTKNKVRLTFQELESLAALDLADNPRLERVRDLFLVGSYCGLRFGDWHKIRREMIRQDDDGVELLEIVTEKNTIHVVIPLLHELKTVLEKYDFDLPRISIQKFNDYIKEVCQLALQDATFLRIYSEAGERKDELTAKWKHVSSHAARRSFATNFWEIGVPAPVLMQITGHQTEAMFFQYIDVDKFAIAKEFARQAARRLGKRTGTTDTDD